MSMLNLYPRHQLQASSIVDDADATVEADGYSAFYGYGIAVVCVTIFVFCALVSSVSVWEACAFASLAALLLGVAACFAPKTWFRRARSQPPADVVVITVTAGAARPGYPRPRVNAPPAFAFQQRPLDAAGGEDDPAPAQAAAAAASCVVVCSVCLEDVRGGEMVRQVPACGHIFHVRCIDMWLHSHRTCPMCRCVISPVPTVTLKGAAEAAPAELAADGEHQGLAPE